MGQDEELRERADREILRAEATMDQRWAAVETVVRQMGARLAAGLHECLGEDDPVAVAKWLRAGPADSLQMVAWLAQVALDEGFVRVMRQKCAEQREGEEP